MNLTDFITLQDKELKAQLLKLCHCEAWAESVIRNLKALKTKDVNQEDIEDILGEEWDTISETSKLQAFSAHPKIGDLNVLREKLSSQANTEQGQIRHAKESTIHQLAEKNDIYYKKFGFIFIICAKGKPAEKMLHHLNNRLKNTRNQEIENAATEQKKIFLLRFNDYINS